MIIAYLRVNFPKISNRIRRKNRNFVRTNQNLKSMEQTTFYEICGWVASICLILGYLPQAIQTIKTRKTDDIALPTFLMMAIGGICFMLQGILHKPEILWALFITNFITTVCSIIVFFIKVYNDYIKK